MKKISILCLVLVLSGISNLQGQKLTIPDVSQSAMVMQRIGLTDISIIYHSPLAQNRKIWGELVPYDVVWRAGANENTTITFSSDVKVEGQLLAAGTYGLHMIPGKSEWIIVFSKNSTSWGSFFYDKAEDALRVQGKPRSVEYQDWLSYNFTDLKSSSCMVNLCWEKLSVSFKLEVDVHEITYNSMKAELRGSDGFTWEAPLQAGRYCMANKIHLDQGKKWVEQSANIQENSANQFTLAKYLSQEGKTEEAKSVTEKAKKLANEVELNMYGYSLLAEKNVVGAIDIFTLNMKRYPDSWNVYDSLAEGYDVNKNKKEALKYYRLALSKAPENQHARITQIIKKIESN